MFVNDIAQHDLDLSYFCFDWTFQQKVSRLALASAFIVGKTSRAVVVRISQLLQSAPENQRINGVSDGNVNGVSDEDESPRK